MRRERELGPMRDNMDVGDVPCTSGRSEGKVLRVGCALLPKKVSRYLTSSMITVAHSRGLELVLLDHTKPILDQGEYDAIVHKLRPNKDWERNLQEYVKARPGVKVIDSLAGIRIVHNRATMLLPLRERPEGIAFQRPHGANGGGFHCARIQSPTQVDIVEGTSLPEAEELLRRAGLRPPLLVKPLWTDGREGSHGLAVLHDMAALGRVLQGGVSASLKPPLVVQQFVEHGGVLFKVYVLGTRTVVCRRPSLGDLYLSQEARRAGVLSLPRISCKSCYARGSPEDRLSAGMLYKTTVAGNGRGGGGGGDGDGGSGGMADEKPEGSASACGSFSFSACASDTEVGSWHMGGGGPLHNTGCATPPSPRLQPGLHHRYQPHHPQQLVQSAAGQQQGQGQGQPGQTQHVGSGQQQGQGQRLLQHQSSMGPHPAAPPDWVTAALAGTLRDKLGLQLFNFDMICPDEQPREPWERLYYVVDINYFPGVDKIPDFEHIFVDFLTDTCGGGASSGSGASDAEPSAAGALSRTSPDPPEPHTLARTLPRADTDTFMMTDVAAGGEGEGEGEGDGISSVSSDKVERLLAADAPAPAAEMEAEALSETSEQPLLELQ